MAAETGNKADEGSDGGSVVDGVAAGWRSDGGGTKGGDGRGGISGWSGSSEAMMEEGGLWCMDMSPSGSGSRSGLQLACLLIWLVDGEGMVD